LKRPYVRFKGSPPAKQAACGHPLPLWTPHAVRLCAYSSGESTFFAPKRIPTRSFNGELNIAPVTLLVAVRHDSFETVAHRPRVAGQDVERMDFKVVHVDQHGFYIAPQ
jgi:hypothetical protein